MGYGINYVHEDLFLCQSEPENPYDGMRFEGVEPPVPACQIDISREDEPGSFLCGEPIGLFPHCNTCALHHGDIDCQTAAEFYYADEQLIGYAQ